MTIKRGIKKIAEKITGTHIYRSLPRGIDPFQDITDYLPMLRIDNVFDIGANTGQSSRNYLNKFPKCHIYCFEPVEKTFRQLDENFRGNKNIQSFRLAFGAAKEKGTMVLHGSSDTFFLLDTAKGMTVNDGANIRRDFR